MSITISNTISTFEPHILVKENPKENPKERGFNFYEFNGGTALAIAINDYAVIAADTRLSSGYSILTRDSSKLHELTSNCILGSAGCKTDIDQLRSVLDIKMKTYRHNHQKSMLTSSVAQLLSNTLYYKRFQPYYAFNVLAGIDEHGLGVIYHYDAIGSFEMTNVTASGSGSSILMPLLDSIISQKNRQIKDNKSMEAEDVVEIVKDLFVTAAERDIYTGDCVEIVVIRKNGNLKTKFSLKTD